MPPDELPPDEPSPDEPTTGSPVAGVLVLVAFGLVVVAFMANVVGRIQEELVFTYVSIGCALTSALLLVFAVHRSR